ncbi:MAG: gliding motility-associated C-terminal domain-containing protein [Saprospirales bacterium]|nr:gliding motility-associated C-terminal domain-containing protein [Saprospirales bacterium]
MPRYYRYSKSSYRIFYVCLLALGSVVASVAQPVPCGPEPDMTSFCIDACVICDIDGYTGINDDPQQGEAPPGFCTTTVHHMQWIAFIAGSTNLTITVTASNCNTGYGLEVGIYESLDCENFNLVSNCDGDIMQGETGVFTNTVPLVIGQYYFFAMDGNWGDVCHYTIHVTQGSTMVPPLPPAEPVAGPIEVCISEPTTYSIPAINGANFYQWTLNGVYAGDGNSTDITFASPGTYQLCVTAFNVCDTVAPSCMTVDVFAPATTDLFPEICSGDCFEVADTTLCDPGNYSFLLTTLHGCDSTVHVSLSVLQTSITDLSAAICETDSLYVGNSWYFPPGQYVEVETAYNGCDSILNLTLDAIICEMTGSVSGQPVICHGDQNGVLTFFVVDGTPPFAYTWERLGGTPSGSGNLPGINTPEAIPNLPTGTYLITINDTYGNDVVLIGEIQEPPVLAASLNASNFNGFNVSCNGGQDGTLSALPQGGVPGYTFLWSTGNTQSTTSGLPAGDCTVTVTDMAGCTVTASAILQEPPSLSLSALFVDPGCEGYDTGLAIVQDVEGGVPPYQYALFNDFSTDTVFVGLTSGSYTLTVQDANGCTANTTGTLTAALIPAVYVGEDLTLMLGESQPIQVIINLDPQTSSWSPAYGLSCVDCLAPVAGPYETTAYTLTVTSEDGCAGSDSLIVHVLKVRDIYVPNIFSPNFDGINDRLTVFAGKSVRQINSLKVFSRWGELVFEQYNFPPNDPGFGWDGSFNGRKIQEGTFVWLAEIAYLDGEKCKRKEM